MRKRNKFSLSHYKLLTAKMGYLYPVACVDVLPGDTLQMATSLLMRFSPLVAPVMTPVTVKLHHWYVPFRLIWDEFEDFITGGPDGMSVPIPPHIIFNGAINSGTLHDYFGISPRESGGDLWASSLYHRAYRLIWNEWYRDQNLQVPLEVPTSSGRETGTSLPNSGSLLRSAWDKDYFTTATPWEQKGAAVNVPVIGNPGGTITISGAPGISGSYNSDVNQGRYGMTGLSGSGSILTAKGFGADYSGDETVYNANSGNLTLTKGTLSANFTASDASLGVVNLKLMREAYAMQRYEEHRALYGSRYVEYLRYLGIKGSDARLQRPEYLGGGRSVIQFSEVLQTAEGTDPVGTMRGHGIGAMRTNRFRRFFEEHGVVMTLMSVRPKSIYTQGMPRKFSKQLKTDYWQKEFEHIGQQEIKNSELYTSSAEPDATFGFADRYDEYRGEWSSVHGEFRDLLNFWHLGREFNEQPVLNASFINSLPSDRIFADQTGNDTLYVMVNNSIQARRIISKRGNPR